MHTGEYNVEETVYHKSAITQQSPYLDQLQIQGEKQKVQKSHLCSSIKRGTPSKPPPKCWSPQGNWTLTRDICPPLSWTGLARLLKWLSIPGKTDPLHSNYVLPNRVHVLLLLSTTPLFIWVYVNRITAPLV